MDCFKGHRNSLFFILFAVVSFSPALLFASADNTDKKKEIKSQFHEQNERCFRCHADTKYKYFNRESGEDVTDRMCEDRIILRDGFYASNHGSFACTDCHSADYDSFPHPGQLRMESQFNCIDCHGYDAKFARFHFEEIEAEFQQSIHYAANDEAFTCWKCHDPHSYRINIRDSRNIKQSIAYDNQICLNCHADFAHFQLLTDREEIDIMRKHEWLPNQALHFSQVRCIECHARLNDSLLVAHRIVPAEKAVRRCVECHSQNSLMMSSLYKFRVKEDRTKAGFLNAVILNNAFIIGANRNIWLNRLSIILFIMTLFLLAVHFTLFIIHKKRSQ